MFGMKSERRHDTALANLAVQLSALSLKLGEVEAVREKNRSLTERCERLERELSQVLSVAERAVKAVETAQQQYERLTAWAEKIGPVVERHDLRIEHLSQFTGGGAEAGGDEDLLGEDNPGVMMPPARRRNAG